MKNIIKNKITVYTPTYNRGYCLHQLYESLLRQNNKNFDWLIIDDGSIDNTKELVNDWIEEGLVQIKYVYQENSGKMNAVNLAHKLIVNELNTCVDSDDYLTDNAIDIILKKWNKIKSNEKLAGLVGLDIYADQTMVGTVFPKDGLITKFSHFETHGIKGDKKFIYKTEIVNKYPEYPNFKNEKFPAPGYLYRLIDQDYDLYLTNEKLCVVEYLEDGISKNKYTQFKKSPNSFAFYRMERMRLAVNFFDKFKNAIHYVNSCIYAKKSPFQNNKFIFTTIFAYPFGIILNIYLNKTNKKGAV